MPFFQVGPVVVEIQSKGGAGVTREPVGPVYEAYNGALRSQVRAMRRTWTGDLPPLADADAQAVVDEIGLGITTVGGDWPGAADIPVYVTVEADVPVKDATEVTLDFKRILSLKAREILGP